MFKEKPKTEFNSVSSDNDKILKLRQLIIYSYSLI